MRFTIGSRALTQASPFNPTTPIIIVHYHPQVWNVQGAWSPFLVQRIDGQAFGVAAALGGGSLSINKHKKVWIEQVHVTVLPNLCEKPEPIPQPAVDPWEQMNGQAARERLERITSTQEFYFVGGLT
jgi:hypothetical protein